ncbi:MAG: amino acid lyase [Bacteroidaceae bacterium]|nr:amino acid lyase [Bacteroidaceae bacterium]
MISLESDYNNGAHPMVMEHLFRTNDELTLTYGFDKYSDDAKQKIQKACESEDAQVFLLTGGTQTNATVIDGMLQSYEAVIAANTGHISIHEAGAVEASGHKVIELEGHEGKLKASDLRDYMEWFVNDESRDHLAQPGMVYISFPTELGTLYSAEELSGIYQVCQDFGLTLFIDGARMGYGLAASTDVTLPWLCKHCDVFYIGGTKVGALCGEAVVFTHQNAPKQFFTIIKRHGALLAKGRLTGVQFDALFSDNLYLRISRHAIDMAMRLKSLLTAKGYRFYIDSPTNQQFVIIPNKRVKTLEKHVAFTHWGPYDSENMICRFVTSWATTDADLDALKKVL